MISLATELKKRGYHLCRECENGQVVHRKDVPNVLTQIITSRKQFLVVPYRDLVKEDVNREVYQIFVRDAEWRDPAAKKYSSCADAQREMYEQEHPGGVIFPESETILKKK